MPNKIFDWRNLKKTDWIALALLGVLLLVIVLPTGEEKNNRLLNAAKQTDTVEENKTAGQKIKVEEAESYVTYLEEKLETVLREMEGVGRVKVMITLSDCGESIVEKDSVEKSNSTIERDDSGGSRDIYEKELQAETVCIENADGNYPYVEKELLPTIEGILVVAEGGGSSFIVSEISKAAMALFPIEAHKIIVVKMSQGG